MSDRFVEGLKSTEKVVGQLLPVLVNRKGEVVDGRHRVKANKNWKRIELDLDELQTNVARLVINSQRRIADEEDYNELASYLQKREQGTKPYLVKSGISIAERISQLTGINARTVRQHLSEDFKNPGKDVAVTSTSGPSRLIRVPREVTEPVQKTVEDLKQIIEEHPDKREEIIERFKEQISLVPALSRPLGPKVELDPTRDQRTDSSAAFVLKLTRWCGATELAGNLPAVMIARILRDMDPSRRQACAKLVSIIVANTEKLEEAAVKELAVR